MKFIELITPDGSMMLNVCHITCLTWNKDKNTDENVLSIGYTGMYRNVTTNISQLDKIQIKYKIESFLNQSNVALLKINITPTTC